MDKIFTEENGYYSIDWSNAVWATDEINAKYHTAKCSLSDVDWIMKQRTSYFLSNIRMQRCREQKNWKRLNQRMRKF